MANLLGRRINGNRSQGVSCSFIFAGVGGSGAKELDCGMYSAVVCGPLKGVCLEPDILVVYGDPAKMTQIMQAKNWLDGRDITDTLSSHPACVYYAVPPIREKKWNISLPMTYGT